MMLRAKRPTGWSAAAVVMLLLGGCGGGSTGNESAPVAAAESPTSAKTGPAAGTAAAGAWQCVDSLAGVAGTRYAMRYRITGEAASRGTEFTTETEVVGSELFENLRATKLVSVFTEGTFSAKSATYLSAEGLTTFFHGGTSLSEQPGDTDGIKTVNVPAAAFRYDLGVGETFTQSHDAASSAATGAGSTETATVTRTVTFVGIESITVPAGTFEACRFTTDEIVTVNGERLETPRTTKWLAVQTGISLRSETLPRSASQVPTVIELLEGRINGQAVIPSH